MYLQRIDPDRLQTPEAFVSALNRLMEGACRDGDGFSYTELEKASRKLAARSRNRRYANRTCGRGSVGPWLRGERLPVPNRSGYPTFELFLEVCGVHEDDLPAWKQAVIRVEAVPGAEPVPEPPAPPRSPLPVGIGVLGAVVLGLGLLAVLSGLGSGPAADIAGWLGLGVLVVLSALLLTVLPPTAAARATVAWRGFLRMRRDHGADVDAALAGWATALADRLDRELAAESGTEPRLRVPWRITSDAEAWRSLREFALSAPGSSGAGDPAGWAEDPAAVHGHDAELADALLDRVPTRRVVVVGGSGSGKTVLLRRLSVAMLDRARDGRGPYPVPFSLESWNPTDPLGTWLARRLVTEHPPLGRRARGHDRSVAEVLLRNGRLLPVLDGLDELGDLPARNSAVRAINDWLAGGTARGIVVAGRPLPESGWEVGPAHTPVASVGELDPDAVRAYLAEPGMGGGRSRSDEIWGELLDDPAHPVARAMRRPLPVGLARSVYTDDPTCAHGDSLERFARERFPDAAAVRAYLVGRFLPSRFDGPGRWEWASARRWLTHLVEVTREPAEGCSDRFVWWELRRRTPWALVPLVLAFPPGLAVGLVAAFDTDLGMGIGAGILAGITVSGLAERLLRGRQRTGAEQRTGAVEDVGPGIASGFLAGAIGSLAGGIIAGAAGVAQDPFQPLMGGLGAGIAAGAAAGPRAGAIGGLAGGATVAFTMGLGPGLPAGVVNGVAVWLAGAVVILRFGIRVPARALRRRPNPWVAWPTGLTVGLVIGSQAASVHGPAVGAVAGLLVGVLGGYAAALSAEEIEPSGLAADPVAVLRTDRREFLRMLVLGGTAFGAGAAVAVTPWVGLAAFVTVGLISGALRTTWPAFTVARLWFALTRRLPLRLLTFLDDARAWDVLRRSGAGYRIRHAALADHLLPPGDHREAGTGQRVTER